jgi:hypothetical protein
MLTKGRKKSSYKCRPWLSNVSCALSWRMCGINPAIIYFVLCDHVFGWLLQTFCCSPTILGLVDLEYGSSTINRKGREYPHPRRVQYSATSLVEAQVSRKIPSLFIKIMCASLRLLRCSKSLEYRFSKVQFRLMQRSSVKCLTGTGVSCRML